MKKTIILFTFLVFGSSITIAQNRPQTMAPHSVFVEFLGNAGIFSINYERHFSPNWSFRAGAGLSASFLIAETETGGYHQRKSMINFPLMLSYVIGTAKHKVEFGAGPMPQYIYRDNIEGRRFVMGASARLGYSYRPSAGGLNFKIAFTPFYDTRDGILPSAGIGVGYEF